jgi:hypothetical protein
MGAPAGLDPKQAHLLTQWALGRPLICCRFDPSGRYAFCGAEDAIVRRVATADGKKSELSGGHDSWVFSVAITPDGKTAFSGGGDGRIAAWAVGSDSPKPLRKFDAHRRWIRGLGVSPDGKLLASGGDDRMVRLWDAATGRPLRELPGHQGHVYSLQFHPDGRSLFSGDLLGSVRQWDVATGKPLGTYDAKPLHTYDKSQMVDFGGVRGLAVSRDGGLVAAGGLHKASNPLGAVHEPIILVFDAKTRKLTRTLLADGIISGVIWRIAFLADGTVMGVSGANSGGFLLFWKPGADKEFHRLALPASARDMDLHPDGLRVALAQANGSLSIIRLAAGKG